MCRFDLPVSPAEPRLLHHADGGGPALAGPVELAAPHQPPSWHRADLLVQHLKDIFPASAAPSSSRWIGERPEPARLPARDRPRAAARPTSIAATAISMSA
jgi:D-amino-acid dehydrogenase